MICEMAKPRKKYRLLKWTAAALLILPVLLAVIGWLCFQRIPGWYQPVYVGPADLDDVRNSLPNTWQALTENAVRGETFDFCIDAKMITAWLVARDALYPDSRDWLPEWIRDPVIVFESDRGIIGARVKREGIEAIVAVHIIGEVDGDRINLRLEQVTAGALPIPSDWIIDLLHDRLARVRVDREKVPAELANAIETLKRDPGSAFESGLQIGNLFEIKNGNRTIKIHRMWTKDNCLWLRIEPL